MPQYKSHAAKAVHQTVTGLYRTGGVDTKTMRRFDTLCLTPVKDMTPAKIKALRLREKSSQNVFAAYLNVTPGLISKWERGEKKPQGASLKLLSLIDKNGLEFVA